MKKKREIEEETAQDTGKVLSDEDLDQEILEEVEEIVAEPVQDKAAEYLQMAQRVQADFDNYRKRNLEIANISRKDGIAFAVETLLPVIDSINSAKRVVDDELKKSIELVYNQTLDCFSKLGVKKIEALNMPFNPEFHNAIMAEEVDGVEPDIVIEEYQEGFELNGKIIRHSVVKVSK